MSADERADAICHEWQEKGLKFRVTKCKVT